MTNAVQILINLRNSVLFVAAKIKVWMDYSPPLQEDCGVVIDTVWQAKAQSCGWKVKSHAFQIQSTFFFSYLSVRLIAGSPFVESILGISLEKNKERKAWAQQQLFDLNQWFSPENCCDLW